MPDYFASLKKDADVQIMNAKYRVALQEIEKRSGAAKATP